jgi:lysophospholipase L1-like esterase
MKKRILASGIQHLGLEPRQRLRAALRPLAGRGALDRRPAGAARRDYEVINEGLNGARRSGTTRSRNTAAASSRSCRSWIAARPLDLVIVSVGSNDLKARFHVPPRDVARARACWFRRPCSWPTILPAASRGCCSSARHGWGPCRRHGRRAVWRKRGEVGLPGSLLRGRGPALRRRIPERGPNRQEQPPGRIAPGRGPAPAAGRSDLRKSQGD